MIVPPKSKTETAENTNDREEKASADWWMVRLTVCIAIIGGIQAWVFWVQAGRLKETIDKMDEIAQGQTRDMNASIDQATRAATAMEGVATSMAANVIRLQETVSINRAIADRQKSVSELQTRAYISVWFEGMVPQDIKTGIRFEPRMRIVNDGLTPTYDLVYRIAADVLPHPIRKDFSYPYPDISPTRSASVLGPRQWKTIAAVAPRLYPEAEARQIMLGIAQRIHVWGVIEYRDAFNITRTTRFCQSFMWRSANEVVGLDTADYNDAT